VLVAPVNLNPLILPTAIIAVSMLAGIVATTPITTVYADESKTEKNQNCNIDGVITSGESNVGNAMNCQLDTGF
jgi:hypothetical protein